MNRTKFLTILLTLALVVVLATSCTPTKTPATTPAVSDSVTMQQYIELASRVDTLDLEIKNLSKVPQQTTDYSKTITDLQSQVSGLTKSINDAKTSANSAVATSSAATANLANLTTVVNSLKASITALQNAQAANTVIGTTPININGLSVTFLTSTAYMPTINNTTPATVQFAVKITNATDKDLTNVDITGAIVFSSYLYHLADGYPKIVDADGKTTYNFFYNGATTVNFEVYSTQVLAGRVYVTSNLSIPKQSSITLRPRISIQSSADYSISAQTVNLSLSTIAYDIVTP